MEPTIGREVQIVSNLIYRRFYHATQGLGGEEFTHRQGQIIHFIYSHQADAPLFQRDIEEAFSIRRPTATGILQLMEKNGLIRRESVDYDARLKKLVLTDKAVALHAQIRQIIEETERELASGSTQEELAVTRRVLARMRKNLAGE